ncbi:MAG: 5'/3'-nucleotidase SurE [Planctomycetota bacterium]|nr:MAG: 5'/3'-nucleotidase SurE [Planctomycetota bacterium]
MKFKPSILLLLLPLAGLSFALPLTRPAETAEPWRILVTNDDGIETPGISALVQALQGIGEVWVCAPAENCSGSSQSVRLLQGETKVEQRTMAGAKKAWAVYATPADSVNVGLVEFTGERPFDLVISGINRGSNVGLIAHYSGTVGAAKEGLMHGVAAMAVSQSSRYGQDYRRSAKAAAWFAAELLKRGPTPGVLYSLNVPHAAEETPLQFQAAPMGGRYLTIEEFDHREGENAGVRWLKAKLSRNPKAPAGSDSEVYAQGKISVTPILLDATATEIVQTLNQWKWPTQ